MKFIGTALGWATLLAVPCWLASPAWQVFLARAASAAMATVGSAWYLRDVDLLAPCDLGIYLALVLASRSTPRPVRLRAGLLGVALLIVLEVIIAVLILVQITLQQPPVTPSRENLRTLLKYVIDSALLWGPVAMWLLFLGRYELPAILARGTGAPVAGSRRSG